MNVPFAARSLFIAVALASLAGCEVSAGDQPDVDVSGPREVDAANEVDVGEIGEPDVDATIEPDTTSDDAGADADTATPRDFGPPVRAALAASLQGVLDANFARVNAAAVAIGVRLPDGSWWEGASGEACYEPATAVAVGDRFRLGSITKTWVAAAVLQLVDEGRVDLDGPVDDYVAGFDLGPEVTVRRCLSHTTGIFDLTDDVLSVEADFTQPIEPGEIVRQSLAHGPDFAPGTDWEYSNTNYFLLGMLLQQVTGEPLAQVLRERLIAPLGLRDTFLEQAEPATTTFICGNVGPYDVTHLIDLSFAWAAGAMVSSNGDLCRWADALWRGAVVPTALRDEMEAPTVLPDGRSFGYGLGTMIRNRAGLTVVGHNGQTLGFQSELFIDPASGLCVSVLANDFEASPSVVGTAAWELLVPALGLTYPP